MKARIGSIGIAPAPGRGAIALRTHRGRRLRSDGAEDQACGTPPRAEFRGRSLGGPDPGWVTGPELREGDSTAPFREPRDELHPSKGGGPFAGERWAPRHLARRGAIARAARPGAIWRGGARLREPRGRAPFASRAPFGASREVVTPRASAGRRGKADFIVKLAGQDRRARNLGGQGGSGPRSGSGTGRWPWGPGQPHSESRRPSDPPAWHAAVTSQ